MGYTDPAEEFEHLAQWLPALEGISPSLSPTCSPPESSNSARGGKKRAEPIELTAIPKSLEPSHDPRNIIEEHPAELTRAVRTLRKLESLLSHDDTVRHAVVLIAAYLSIGSEARKRLDRHGGVGALVGLVTLPFAEQARQHDIGKLLQQGNILLDEARSVWANLPHLASRPVADRGRIRLNDIRDTIDRATVKALQQLSARMVTRENVLRSDTVETAISYSVPDVAALVGCDDATLRRRIKAGEIPAELHGGRYYVPAAYVHSLPRFKQIHNL